MADNKYSNIKIDALKKQREKLDKEIASLESGD
jgi:hypothetical protein